MTSFQWAPSRTLYAGLVLGLGLLLLAVYLATHRPALGLSTEPGERGVRVTHVLDSGPLAGLVSSGDELIAMSAGDQTIRLEPGDAVAEPDDAPTFAEYNRFFERQARLWSLFQADRVHLKVVPAMDPGGPPREIQVDTRLSLSPAYLPAVFWYQLACGLAIFWMGIAAWAFVRDERGPLFYALAGFAMALAVIASAVYTTRELLMPADLLLVLSRVNQFGAMLFAGAGTTLLWYYPTRISRFRFEWLMVLLVGLILAANWGQWGSSLDLVARYTLLAWGLTDIVLAVVQWRRTRSEPVERARLKWFVYSWFGGVIGYLGLVIVPQVLGASSLIHQKYGWGLFVVSYLGIALGIVRFRLFDLDRWILMAWFWFACGILIFLVDGVLVLWLNLQYSLGLVISLALVGWIYFPLRQLFLSRLLPSAHRGKTWQQLPRLISEAFDAHQKAGDQWRSALTRLFDPLSCEWLDDRCPEPRILDNGLRLRVPDLNRSRCLQFSYANQGHRLFDRQDLEFVGQAYDIFDYARRYRESFQTGVITERERVARDLHDDVGARLLSIIYRADGTELGRLARECLRELRDVIQGLQSQAVTLAQSVVRAESEARGRCQLFGLELTMTCSDGASATVLTPRMDRNLISIVRECLSNTIRHACADAVRITVERHGNQLVFDYVDNGVGLVQETGGGGFGLYSIRERCEELGGEVVWYCPVTGGAGARCVVPVPEGYEP